MTALCLKDAEGEVIRGVFNVTLTHEKELPAILTWQVLHSTKLTTPHVSLWMGDRCLFKGSVNACPIEFIDDVVVYSAIALNHATFQTEKLAVLAELEADNTLTGNIKGCVGGKAGRLYINPVTHSVSWCALKLTPNHTTFNVHAAHNLKLTPVLPVQNTIHAHVSWKSSQTVQGIMDVGEYISAQFPSGIETYTGPQLQAQVEKFAFKALKFGYEVQTANLVKLSRPTPADKPGALTLHDTAHSVVGLPFAAYGIDLKLAWYTHVQEQHQLSIQFGDDIANDVVQLKVKDGVDVTEDLSGILTAAKQWMQAHATTCALTHTATFKVLVTHPHHFEHLKLGNTCVIHDTRFTGTPLLGVIDKYNVTLNNRECWVIIHAQIAINKPLSVVGECVRQNEVTAIQTPKRPSDVVAYAKTINNAGEQKSYYDSTSHANPTEFWKHFPTTQLEIGLNPPCGSGGIYGTTTHTIQHNYTIQ